MNLLHEHMELLGLVNFCFYVPMKVEARNRVAGRGVERCASGSKGGCV